MSRVLITGVRLPNGYIDRAKFEAEIDKLLERLVSEGEPISILNGGQVGIDRAAQAYANKKGYDFFMYKPWHLIDSDIPFSPRLFFMKSKQMLDNTDVAIIIRSTAHDDSYVEDIVRRCQNKRNPTKYCEVYLDE